MLCRAPAGRLEVWLQLAICASLAIACGRPAPSDPRTVRLLPAESQATTNASGFLSFVDSAERAWPLTVTLSGLTPTETYRLTLNGYPGEAAANTVLVDCPIPGKLSAGNYLGQEGYCDFKTVTTNEFGSAMEQLRLEFPPAAYRLKFLVKKNGGADGRDYGVVLKADDLRFAIVRPGWRIPGWLVIGLCAAALTAAGFIMTRRLRRSPPRIPDLADSAPQASIQAPPRYVFRRRDSQDAWEIGSPADPSILPHVDGFSYISFLLGRPNQNVSALDLYRTVNPPPVADSAQAPRLESTQHRVLDDRAVRQLRDRLRDLMRKQEEIESSPVPDLRALEEVESEKQHIVKQLKDSGKVFANADMERPRVAVAHALSRAFAHIRRHEPDLERHLKGTIQSGGTLCYRPPPGSPAWLL